MAGMTDYTGVSMDVILSHLRSWKDSADDCVAQLTNLRTQADAHRDRLDRPDDILGYVAFFIDLVGRYASDFQRLVKELPGSVKNAHVEIVQQIYDSSRLEENKCIMFKDEHIGRRLKDESLRWLVDGIYAESRDMMIDCRDLSNVVPRLRTFVGTSSDPDRRFAMMAIEEALKSVSEDERPRPKVGAIVVKDGRVLSKAHRGEKPKSHAEYLALEDKLPDDLVAGSTVYTTLEPCTTRNHPKIPCAQRLVDRKVARVVIGMLDPNPEIRGLGDQFLSDAGIETQLFPRDLRSQVEEMNREFIRTQKQRQKVSTSARVSDTPVMYAARALTEATRDLQKAVWSFHSLHIQYFVVRAAREVAEEEKQILKDIGTALRVFTQDYDFPPDLTETVKAESANINIDLANVKAFSMTGQKEAMESAATRIQEACERIRLAARPYAYTRSS